MVAAATDFLDGIVARKLNQVTKLGAELDPIADKAFLFLVLLYALFQSDSQQQVILGLVLAIDVIIAAHTLLARSQHGTVMRVTKIGKAGSFARMACVTFLLLAEVGDDMVYRVAEIVGAMAGGAGVCLGLTALWQYQRQI